MINGLDSEVFKNPNNKKALTNKLNAVIRKLENEEIEGALKQLDSDVLNKTDGCALVGDPDSNDWIRERNAQNTIYPFVLVIIDLLQQELDL